VLLLVLETLTDPSDPSDPSDVEHEHEHEHEQERCYGAGSMVQKRGLTAVPWT
jgi:hypothetical protein